MLIFTHFTYIVLYFMFFIHFLKNYMKKGKKIDLIFRGKLSIDKLLRLKDLEPAWFHQDVVHIVHEGVRNTKVFVEYEYQFEKL